MTDKHHIALLPGLDGTGILFDPIIPYLEDKFSLTVVEYSNQATLAEFVACAEAQLPKYVPLSLVAESFSGPIAISLLANKPFDFSASVLSATFSRSPMPLLTRFSRLIPEIAFEYSLLNRVILDFFGTDKETDQSVKDQIYKVSEKSSSKNFKTRIQLINSLDVTSQLKEVKVPLLYIRASNDRIVPAHSGPDISRHVKEMEIANVEGPHMILQARPKHCADLIIKHVTSSCAL